MHPTLKDIIDKAKVGLQKAIEHYEVELQKIRAGRANPVMLEGIRVDYYGAPTPINQVGNVNVADSRTLTVQPFDRKLINTIEKAIVDANLGVATMNDGIVVRVTIPPMTEDRRKGLVKQVKEATEDARVALRNVRRDHIEAIKKAQKGGVAEDEAKAAETEIEKIVKNSNTKLDEIFAAKEKDVMTV